MNRLKCAVLIILLSSISWCCSKSGTSQDPPPVVQKTLNLKRWSIGNLSSQARYEDVAVSPAVRFEFSTSIDRTSIAAISLKSSTGALVPLNVRYLPGDSIIDITTLSALNHLSVYTFQISNALKSSSGGKLQTAKNIDILTSMDSSDKFSRVSDEELLTIIQQKTFNYFWQNGHPVSGMARERDNSGDVVTTGGTGFGIMSILAAIQRTFITRQQGLDRLIRITDFLSKADRFHGAFPHWMNGGTGKVIPFSEKDNGADLVETSFLMQGLLSARQFFDGANQVETALRDSITNMFKGVEWSAFVPAGSNQLYWHLNPSGEFAMNMPVSGWNEALITYVLAASSPTFPITKQVYETGWALNGAIKNGNSYYNILLPLGEPYGGPLFFSHYSFLGLDPNGLKDQYADYEIQVKSHSMIYYKYALDNPRKFFGYSNSVWGLTASDDNDNGYAAHSITNDNGVVAPTAAVSSLPFTPVESMQAIQFYYYKLGDRLFGEYGFMDAFSLTDAWFSNSYLAIDQGPMIVMIENYRSGLLWNLFMSCPELKNGLTKLGFTGPKI